MWRSNILYNFILISRKIQYNYSSSLGRTLLLFNDIGKYITLGPDSDYITQNFTNESATISERFKNTYNTDDIWFDYFINQHPKIITDNPSTMLAHYFINDFENFHIFYNQPTEQTFYNLISKINNNILK